MAKTNGTGNESGPTRRVVLKRERVITLPTGDIDAAVAALQAADKKRWGKNIAATDAWVVIGEFEGASKTNAIAAHAGEPGTPDAKPGAYKAPAVSAWAGGELYEAPPAPLVQRRALEDD